MKFVKKEKKTVFCFGVRTEWVNKFFCLYWIKLLNLLHDCFKAMVLQPANRKVDRTGHPAWENGNYKLSRHAGKSIDDFA